MSKSKNAVKRGSAGHKQYLAEMMELEDKRDNQIWWRNRQFVLDSVTIALGELLDELQMESPELFQRKFCKKYLEVEREVSLMTHNEYAESAINRDKVGSIWASKDKVDRLIKQYIYPEDFVPFDARYDREQPYVGKDQIILSQRQTIEKLEDEITRLKGQIRLMRIKNDNNARP